MEEMSLTPVRSDAEDKLIVFQSITNSEGQGNGSSNGPHANEWKYSDNEEELPDSRPLVPVEGSNGALKVVECVAEALLPHNCFFVRHEKVVRLVEDQELCFKEFSPAAACTELECFMKFVKAKTQGSGRNRYVVTEQTMLNKNLAGIILESPRLKEILPKIVRIADYPMPIRNTRGAVTMSKPGYDPETLIYSAKGVYPEVMSLDEAKNLLENDLLADFCFSDVNGDGGDLYRRSAILYLLTCHARLLWEVDNGRAPIFYASGNQPGVGKDFLLGLGPLLATGHMPEYSDPPESSAETKKTVLGLCKAGKRFWIISNAKNCLDNKTLEAWSVTGVINGRMLNSNNMPTFENSAIWGLSGNNLTYSDDLVRRIVPIAQHHDGEHIGKREYKHPDLYAWVLENRERLLGALQTMVNHWAEKGCPEGREMKPSHIQWSAVAGGIMETCGYENPINQAPSTAAANPEKQAVKELIRSAWGCKEKLPVVEVDNPFLRKQAEGLEQTLWGDLSQSKSKQTLFGNRLERYDGIKFEYSGGLTLVMNVDRTASKRRYHIYKVA